MSQAVREQLLSAIIDEWSDVDDREHAVRLVNALYATPDGTDLAAVRLDDVDEATLTAPQAVASTFDYFYGNSAPTFERVVG